MGKGRTTQAVRLFFVLPLNNSSGFADFFLNLAIQK